MGHQPTYEEFVELASSCQTKYVSKHLPNFIIEKDKEVYICPNHMFKIDNINNDGFLHNSKVSANNLYYGALNYWGKSSTVIAFSVIAWLLSRFIYFTFLSLKYNNLSAHSEEKRTKANNNFKADLSMIRELDGIETIETPHPFLIKDIELIFGDSSTPLAIAQSQEDSTIPKANNGTKINRDDTFTREFFK